MSAGAVAVTYALVGTLWIVLSDAAIERGFPDLAQVGKGMAFVAVTAVVLYVLLRRRDRRLVASRAEERALLERLVTAEDETARQIAADLHDGPVQELVALGIRLGSLRRRAGDPELRRAIAGVEEGMQGVVTALRSVLSELAPPALRRGGLGSAVWESAEAVFAGTEVVVVVTEDRLPPLPDETATAAYRIVREALRNARAHSRARHVTVHLQGWPAGLGVRVADDGVGIGDGGPYPAPGHLGLPSMRERAAMVGGWCRVGSRHGGGTVVEAWLPAAPPNNGPATGAT